MVSTAPKALSGAIWVVRSSVASSILLRGCRTRIPRLVPWRPVASRGLLIWMASNFWPRLMWRRTKMISPRMLSSLPLPQTTRSIPPSKPGVPRWHRQGSNRPPRSVQRLEGFLPHPGFSLRHRVRPFLNLRHRLRLCSRHRRRLPLKRRHNLRLRFRHSRRRRNPRRRLRHRPGSRPSSRHP